MISEHTLNEAIQYIIEHETRLLVAQKSAIKARNDDNAAPFYDALLDLIEVRKHIYQLNSGINQPSPHLENMTGIQLVEHFAQLEED